MTALEDQLTLATWFASSLGYKNNANMLQALKSAENSWGHKHHKVLERLCSEDHDISAATWQLLDELDHEIRTDWEEINRGRLTTLSLKYFQYLACLSSAMFLRRWATAPDQLLEELQSISSDSIYLESYNDIAYINKLAFWMATGSGKTLLMHMNYRQFLRQQDDLFVPDNILLITPNEELSQQHIAEMQKSNIPCFWHGDNPSLLQGNNAVHVIEITKFTDENKRRSKGKSDSVSLDAFDGRNLVFVDEGHKGAGGEAWIERRDKLVENGFVFEYSATFGQALAAADNKARSKEYARSILFDYSYRFFYGDGYGKDFSILNIDDKKIPEQEDTQTRDLVMLSNLLAFFQQQLAFDNLSVNWQAYMVEKPLLLLLGKTVSSKNGDTDMMEIITFLHRVAADKRANGQTWLTNAIKKILTGQADFLNEETAFKRYKYLIDEFSKQYNDLSKALRRKLFNTDAPGALRISALKQTKGDNSEIALRIGDNNRPFGLVYVGSPKKLLELLKSGNESMDISEDAIQKPLFPDVHDPDSPINILIGAKKFMEGWSSWRVCGMGLLNVGTNEGAQIIQLFGRGVRLKGKDFTLKRSTALERENRDKPPAHLHLLETLNIFAIRANFMDEFRKYLECEGVSQNCVLPVKINPIIKKKKLQTLKIPPASEFTESVEFAAHENTTVRLDMSIRTQARNASESSMDIITGEIASEISDFSCVKALLNFDLLCRRLLNYKRTAMRANLLIHRDKLPGILDKCEVLGNGMLDVDSYSDIKRIHDIAFSALCKYADRLYYQKQRQWETRHMDYMPLFDNVKESSEDYTISFVPQRAKEIKDLLENKIRPYLTDAKCVLPRLGGKSNENKQIIFDEHIFIPLLLDEHHKDITLSPPGLTRSERNFVSSLKQYIEENPLTGSKELFLLRNGSKGKGVGFYEDEGFYPDFILWIEQNKKQRIVFVEPHGMIHAPAYAHDFKARLWEELRSLSKKLKSKGAKKITLDSYIISETRHVDLKKKYSSGNWSKSEFAKRHILFSEDGADMIKQILS